MTSTNSISASSNNAIDALVAALVGLNMSPVTANAIVTIIQVIVSSELSPPTALPPAHLPEQVDDAAHLGVDADNSSDEPESKATPAHTPPPLTGISSDTTPAPPNITPTLPSGDTTTTTTLVPTAVTPTTTTPVPTTVDGVVATIGNPPPPTNAHSVGLPPTSVSYRGFPYEIPHASAEAPFYCVTKGKRVGVLSTW
ncbi:hypothetical protein CY34DRAFT_16185 [Suillus luteus UH-Slu-Lm8-n1]|uniref:Uncharacterized protein n=1 Tax=Suillus luteus UH-Slu-Lm8-n1 TaxID=930992 RepID=A0A0D0A539_9AGAM|nr:hypothetical protein CY34DRAFT_16185 [Suillus luteus UH-Slu-Lm8-n1]